MEDIFVDDIRSIFVANGVVRIEFGRLKRGDDDPGKVSSEPTATMLLPYNSLKAMIPRLAKAMADVEIAMKKKAGAVSGEADDASETEDALSNL
jgi:hypothetical protein